MALHTYFLAAGSASRFGRPKQLVPVGDQTLIEYCLSQLPAEQGPTTVMLGANADAIRGVLGKGIRTVDVADFSTGLSATLLAVFHDSMKRMHKNRDALLIALADTPYLTREDYERLLDAYSASPLNIIAASAQSRVMPPVILPWRHLQMLRLCKGDSGLGAQLRSHRELVQVEIQNAGLDIDTPEQYQAFIGSGLVRNNIS